MEENQDTSSTGAEAGQAQQPQEPGQEAQGAAIASQATQEQGPPPAFPQKPRFQHAGIQSILDSLETCGKGLEEEMVHAIQHLRLPPEVGIFKAEVLGWIAKMKARV
jgi:hypothetical protein